MDSMRINLIFKITLQGRNCYYPHFTHDKTEAQMIQVTGPKSHNKRVAELGLTSNTVMLDPTLIFYAILHLIYECLILR